MNEDAKTLILWATVFFGMIFLFIGVFIAAKRYYKTHFCRCKNCGKDFEFSEFTKLDNDGDNMTPIDNFMAMCPNCKVETQFVALKREIKS